MKVIGLISGTSSDGIDTALTEMTGKKIQLLDFALFPYPKEVQRTLLDLASGTPHSVALLCHLNFYLGERFAEAAIRIAQRAGVPLSQIQLIGSHGQTVHHLPIPKRQGKWPIRATLQIGEPSVIAERTGITTIADFRPRDMAAGGEGAPLTPLLHHHLFSHAKTSRAIVNIGGISNVTYLKARGALEAVRAFDTGPGNMLMDQMASALLGQKMDFNGAYARRGQVCPALLSEWMRDPFIKKAPPKSTGRERFGRVFLETILKKHPDSSPADLIATAAAYTAEAIAWNIKRFILSEGSLDEVIVGGGGVRNPVVMARLAERLAPIPVHPFEVLGWDSRAIEATTFALLAYYTWHSKPAGLPAVTGARRPTVLGKIVPASAK